jgi:hypothetical protein
MNRPIHEILKEARLKKGIELEKISTDIFIPVKFLRYMEEGHWQKFPSFVHKIAFLKKYLIYLNISPDIINNYPEFVLQTNQMSEEKHQTVSRGKNKKLPLYIITGVIIMGIGGITMYLANQRPQDVKNSQYLTSSPDSQNRLCQIMLKATEPVWVRLICDGDNILEKTLNPNEVFQASGQRINIRIGNVAGLLIEKQGKTYGPFGKRGQVIEIKMENGILIR